MTRSGIVQSVHAFGQDNTLAYIFVAFISVVIVFSFGYVIYRLPLLRSRNELDSWISREFSFLLNNWILLGCAFFILVATLFPTISEFVTGERITVGPPFFTKWLAIPGLALLFLTGLGPNLAWRKASTENLKSQFAIPVAALLLVAVVLGAFTPLRGWSETTIKGMHLAFPLTAPVMCFALCGFVLATIAQEFYRGTRVRQAHTKLDFFTSLIGLVARGKRRYGGYLVHVAIVLMFIGFAGGGYKKEADFTVEKGQKVSLGKYTLQYEGLSYVSAPDKDATTANIPVYVDGKLYTTVHPAKWAFRHHEDEPPTTEVALHRTPLEDLYVVLNGVDTKLGIANLKVVINPLVDWIWVGFLLLAFGTIIAFMPDRAYVLAAQAAGSDKSKGITTALILVAMLFGGGLAHAQEQQRPMEQVQGGMHTARNAREQALFQRFKCLCGTCSHALDECESDGCMAAENRRTEIQGLVDKGMSDQAIASFEIGRYGEETLRMPLDKGYRRLVWVLPVGALLGAVGLLAVVARKWTRPAVVADAGASVGKTATPAADHVAAADDEYQSRLDDELDELD
jgi:cytochrome c-type biogenesis protein CcmF